MNTSQMICRNCNKTKSIMTYLDGICEDCHIEVARKSAGIPPRKIESRLCLRCEGEFTSKGIHNRICDRCNEIIRGMGPDEEYPTFQTFE